MPSAATDSQSDADYAGASLSDNVLDGISLWGILQEMLMETALSTYMSTRYSTMSVVY